MSEQVVLSAVAQRIIVKFLTKENVKLTEILMRLRSAVQWCNTLKNPGV